MATGNASEWWLLREVPAKAARVFLHWWQGDSWWCAGFTNDHSENAAPAQSQGVRKVISSVLVTATRYSPGFAN
jgi:hypothetical protein